VPPGSVEGVRNVVIEGGGRRWLRLRRVCGVFGWSIRTGGKRRKRRKRRKERFEQLLSRGKGCFQQEELKIYTKFFI
jgi:hypothetical protein